MALLLQLGRIRKLDIPKARSVLSVSYLKAVWKIFVTLILTDLYSHKFHCLCTVFPSCLCNLSFSKCPVPFFNVIIQPISSCPKHKTRLTSPSTSISHAQVTITVFSSPLSLVLTKYHLFIQSIQPAGFSKSLFILCSFFLDSLPLLTILLKMPQTGKSVADSKLGCVE